jgi:hypothetical protein
VSNGSKIKFWHNVWYGGQNLKAAFPEFFSIARCNEASVANHVQFYNDTL